ncbi:sugar phosphate isomerase/epimerase [Phreatobacter aquaticus]|uniref:Sugar phosphate isomerase/epimerase n=2 Tax=Phreatobacter aquaticus TaxID=2570229 RepID=A0A4D7QMU3_9HYPH|nr:sugar phosphate isomerase/epimerase [Phreatobacter aquaticus]
MRIALCNEVVRDLPFAQQCELAASLGYDGLEIAPFTLGTEPHLLPASDRAAARRAAADAGIAICGLHWLLVAPAGLSITTDDVAIRARSLDVMRGLVDLAADLGAGVLVHGSPGQRELPDGAGAVQARQRGTDMFAAIGEVATRTGLTYCIEPLASTDTQFVTTVEEAVGIVRAINLPGLKTMIDCSAARTESLSVPDLIDRYLPTGLISHIHFNDPNRRGPGQGALALAPVLDALRRQAFAGWTGVEPFDYVPDGPGSAARAIGYLRGIEEALS